ncbi:MAG TPA: hypothetical protein PK967_04615 [Candidatus Hydrogenedentes bacterium]|nr:hypothetical protein [Candidatus Hydrogenedentota bacterium]
MTGKSFLNGVTRDREDILGRFLLVLAGTEIPYCVIGGLAVNAYVEPVVSLDLDVVVALDRLDSVLAESRRSGLTAETFEHSVNLESPDSDLRIQLQTDGRYQPFLARAVEKDVLGYRMRVACVEDVLQGKVWVYSDETRRRSKRQKDLADIMRLVEAFPALRNTLPEDVRRLMD